MASLRDGDGRRRVPAWLAIGLGGLLTFAAWQELLAVSDRIVAVVEAGIVSEKPVKPRVITASEVEEAARPMLERIRQEGGNVDQDKFRQKVLEELIQRVLREQKAEQMGLNVSDQDVDSAMAQVERNNQLPPGKLPEALVRQGIDPEGYRQGLRDQILKTRLITKVIRPMVSVSDDEIRALHDVSQGGGGPREVRLGQILLAVDGSTSASKVAEKAELAEKLAGRLRTGESLANLAGQFSDDPSGIEGGEIGWFKQGEIMPELETVVFAMRPGEVTKPIRTPQGYHVVVVLESRQGKGTGGSGQVKVRARHILLKVGEGAGGGEERQVLEKLQKIRQELMKGADFAKVAREISQDGSAKDGGELGWFGPGMMVAPFEEAAFRLRPNELSQPVRTPFGWHLILVEEKKELAPDSLEARRKELEERLMESKLNARYNQWLRDIRLRAFVEYR
ncbi:Chaperone SurA [Candidatus Magnetaquicoccaceae bacterium FCR-1]|uniref:Chaperone SurA n=1 Tax=Candidatus Magnetaquiglobus chichijimensis TaxID=3141448 RepID=A0ABQ0C7D1_9PROT